MYLYLIHFEWIKIKHDNSELLKNSLCIYSVYSNDRYKNVVKVEILASLLKQMTKSVMFVLDIWKLMQNISDAIMKVYHVWFSNVCWNPRELERCRFAIQHPASSWSDQTFRTEVNTPIFIHHAPLYALWCQVWLTWGYPSKWQNICIWLSKYISAKLTKNCINKIIPTYECLISYDLIREGCESENVNIFSSECKGIYSTSLGI